MSETTASARVGRRELLLAAGFLLLFVALFSWAKWEPYAHKIPALAQSHDMGTPAIGPDTPWFSVRGGAQFLRTYLAGVWPAIVAGLVVAAGLQGLVPRGWLLRWFDSAGPVAGPVRAALAGMPMMLCTCCSAPVAVGLRQSRVPVRNALAYWLATPLLNPAVMVFAALALSPGWMGLRLGLGLAVVVAATWLAARGRPATLEATWSAVEAAGPSLRAFVDALVRLTIRLLPEYVVLIFLLGAVRGLLFPLGHDLAAWGVAGALLLAVTGMLLAVPTGGEVAVVAALLGAGAPAWLAGALLVTLPALSLPSLTMVAGSFPRRVLLVAPLVVVVAGLVASGVALLLPL